MTPNKHHTEKLYILFKQHQCGFPLYASKEQQIFASNISPLCYRLCCGFNIKQTMADWESLTGGSPHTDFMSLYMSRTQVRVAPLIT